jgi:hypothetical protein
MVNKVTNRVTICQAWLAISTATGLFMPTMQKIASEIPGVVRDIEAYNESEANLNKLIKARNAKAAPQILNTPFMNLRT